jgi:hypothetical protein
VWFALDQDAVHAAMEAIYEAQAAVGDLAATSQLVASELS